MADNRPLPPGFIAQYDNRYARNFYVNTATGQSQWEDPRPAYYANSQGGQRGMGGPPPNPPPYYSQGPPQPQQQYYSQGPPPPQQQYYNQGPPPQQYYNQGPLPPQQQYYGHAAPQQHPQAVIMQGQGQKQSFFQKHPMMTGLAAGAAGAFAVNEFQDHMDEERQEAFDAGQADGFGDGYDQGFEDGGDF